MTTKAAVSLIHRLRLRVLGLLLGLVLAALATISLTAIPAWPVVGVAVAAAYVGVNRIMARITPSSCPSCGHNLQGLGASANGIVCPECGSVGLGRPAPDASETEARDADPENDPS